MQLAKYSLDANWNSHWVYSESTNWPKNNPAADFHKIPMLMTKAVTQSPTRGDYSPTWPRTIAPIILTCDQLIQLDPIRKRSFYYCVENRFNVPRAYRELPCIYTILWCHFLCSNSKPSSLCNLEDIQVFVHLINFCSRE